MQKGARGSASRSSNTISAVFEGGTYIRGKVTVALTTKENRTECLKPRVAFKTSLLGGEGAHRVSYNVLKTIVDGTQVGRELRDTMEDGILPYWHERRERH